MCDKRKRISLDLEMKMTIISDIESGKKQSAIATSHGLAKTTVSTIWSDRAKIKRAYEESPANSRK